MAGSGIEAPRIVTLNGARYGRVSSGSAIRSLITASCAAVNATSTPNENRLARKTTSCFVNEVATTIADDMTAAARIAGRRDVGAAAQAPERLGELAVLAERVGEAGEAGDRGGDGGGQDQRAGDADVRAEDVAERARQLGVDARGDAEERRADPARPQLGVRAGERRHRDEGDQDVDRDDGGDAAEHRARQVDSGAAGFLGEVRDRLEPGERQHRERQREGERVPGRLVAERHAARERVAGEDEDEPEHDEEQLGDQVERRHDDAEAVERRAADQPHAGDEGDHRDAEDDVPRVVVERGDLERARQVVRDEERRQGDHDQVVEAERPAGEEAGEVVVGAADERRGAAGLGDRRGALGVRERDDEEEQADDQEDERREAERVGGEDAEGEVDRRCDLAVGDGEERARVELAAEAGELAGH